MCDGVFSYGRDGLVGVYRPIIRIPHERWDDHPQYREFRLDPRTCVSGGTSLAIREIAGNKASYIQGNAPFFG